MSHLVTSEARTWLQRIIRNRMQRVVDARLSSNLMHALTQMVDRTHARRVANYIAVLIDGYWLRHAKSDDAVDAVAAIRQIEEFVELHLSAAQREET